MRFFVAYKYVDQDGVLRRAESRIEPEVWRRFSPGDKLHVLYARAPGPSWRGWADRSTRRFRCGCGGCCTDG